MYMSIKLFSTHFWLYFSYVVTFLLPLVYGFALFHIRMYQINKDIGWHPRRVLGCVFLLIGALLIQTMLQDFYIFYIYQDFNDVPFSMNFGLALPPLLYFYFRKLMLPEKLNRRYLILHLFPVVAIALFEAAVILLHYADRLCPAILIFAEFYEFVYPTPLVFSGIFYLFYIVRLRRLYLKNINDNYSFVEGVDLRWINTMIILYILLVAIILPSFVVEAIWLKHVSNIAFVTFVSYLFIRSINDPHIHYESSFHIRVPSRLNTAGGVSGDIVYPFEFVRDVLKGGQDPPVEFPHSPPVSENVNISLQAARKAELKTKLVALFEIRKVQLKSTLTLNEVAQMLNTNRTYISNIVNSEFDLSFYQFVNKYRIDEATRIFKKNPDASNGEVAQIVGFNSISSFIIAFKVHRQCTPKEWKRKHSPCREILS